MLLGMGPFKSLPFKFNALQQPHNGISVVLHVCGCDSDRRRG
jgi:hypothetical protein